MEVRVIKLSSDPKVPSPHHKSKCGGGGSLLIDLVS
jgi:hypothetical protein